MLNAQEHQLLTVVLSVVVLMLYLSIVQEKHKVSHISNDASCCDCVEVKSMGTTTSTPRLVLVAGTHGNEPSGTYAILQMLSTVQTVSNGTVVFIPRVNPCGLQRNERNQPNVSAALADINRNYRIDSGGPIGKVAQTVAAAVHGSQCVLDFHEGYSFHKIDSASIGSCVLPSRHKFAQELADGICEALNKDIDISWKKFTCLHNDAPSGTLRAFCNFHDIPYVLIETSGQNEIQEISVREKQCLCVINYTCNQLGISVSNKAM